MKNPFLSMWLSAANKAAGSARGFWSAEARRQQNAAVKEMSRALFGGAAKKRGTSRRRSK